MSKPKLTRKQQVFVQQLVDNPKTSGIKAAMVATNASTPGSAGVYATQTLKKPNVMQWLADHAAKAENTLTEVMTYSTEYGRAGSAAYAGVAASAANSVLDRVHGKPTQRVEQTSVAVTIGIDLSGEAWSNEAIEPS